MYDEINRYLLSTYRSHRGLDAGDTAMNKSDRVPALSEETHFGLTI